MTVVSASNRTAASAINQRKNPDFYCSFEYSAFACFRMGTSGSASFQSVRKSWYAARALTASPLQRIGAGDSEMRQRAGLARSYQPAVVQDFLKFSGGGGALFRGQIRLAANICGINTTLQGSVGQFIGRGGP